MVWVALLLSMVVLCFASLRKALHGSSSAIKAAAFLLEGNNNNNCKEGFFWCGSPTGPESSDPFDLQLGENIFYNTEAMLLRRKLEEQANLRQAIEAAKEASKDIRPASSGDQTTSGKRQAR